MPRIPLQDLNCAFYLYPSRAAAESGLAVGGSGFWVAITSLRVPEFWWLYGVSNQHVVHRSGASVIRANSKDGGLKIIEAEPTDWIEHPGGHDVAILPIEGNNQPTDIEVMQVSPGMFVTREGRFISTQRGQRRKVLQSSFVHRVDILPLLYLCMPTSLVTIDHLLLALTLFSAFIGGTSSNPGMSRQR